MRRIVCQAKSKLLGADGNFFKSVSILVSGTAFAQLLTVVSLPIITRLYTPEQFAIYAIYASMLTILSSICCLRFDIAIPLPKEESEAVSLVIISILSNLIFSIILCVVIFLFSQPLLLLTNREEIGSYIWWLPVGVFFTGLFSVFQYWTMRKKQYILIAKANILQSGISIVVQILSALLSYGALGLIVGQIIKSSFGTLKLVQIFLRDYFITIKQQKLDDLYFSFKKNIDFPKYSVGDALANTASTQLPIIMIAMLASANSKVGFLILAMQLLSIPIVFIGRAVSQVYLAEAPIKVKDGSIGRFTVNILDQLLLIGVNILIVIGILSPIFIKYIFGRDWSEMGSIISWMVPWFIFQLLASPISMIMHIIGKQKQMLLLTLFGFLLKIIAIFIQYVIDEEYLIQNFAISSAIFYAITCIIFFKYAQVQFLSLIKILKKNATSYICVIVGSYFLLFLCKYWEL